MQTVTMLRRSPNATLQDKLKEHYQNRNFTPAQSSVSRGGLMVVACGIFSLFLECLVVLIPGLYFGKNAEEEHKMMARFGMLGERWWMMMLLVVFTWVEVTWNWWRVYYDTPNWVTKETKIKLFGNTLETPEGWKHCPTCQLDAPPRSHHCNHCGHCILKRDHHCFLTSSCVGFYNQRHFVVFCLYAIWGCFLGIYLQVSFLHMSVPVPEEYLTYLLPPVPVIQLFKGELGIGVFLVLVHVYFNVVFMGMAATFLLWQVVVIVRGQTSHEAWRKVRTYDQGLWGNVTAVFGSPLKLWMLFSAPLMLPMKGDGIKWPVQEKSGKIN